MCNDYPIAFLTTFFSALNKLCNAFMYSLSSHFLLRFFDVLVFFLLVKVLVAFLGNFDTPAPKAVVCKTSGWGVRAPSHFTQAVRVPPINSIYLQHLIEEVDLCKVASAAVFLCGTITIQAASQG